MSASIKLSSPATREFWEIPVLYEDADLLALDKPGDLPVSPDRTQPFRPSLINLLHEGIKRGVRWAVEGRRTYLMPACRLDPETSGVLLLAKSKAVLVTLLNYFGADRPGRRFVALVRGTPLEERFQAEAKLAPVLPPPGAPASLPARLMMRADPRRGKRSVTLFEVRQKFARYTLLQCEPLTDRPHQIRVHLRGLRLPVVGDSLYGGRPLLLSQLKPDYRLKPNKTERPLLAQPAMHAESLALPHPVTGEPLTITAPWPKDLNVAVKYLSRYAPA
jgi:23S rRNA pseudouridine955/2504/2580 synthase